MGRLNLNRIIQFSPSEIFELFNRIAKTKKNVSYNGNNYFYMIGNIPICLVAHADTFHKKPPVDVYYDNQKKVMWSPDGIGGDDRCGIFAILSIIKDFNPSVIILDKEETGCIGAKDFVKDFPEKPQDVKFLIELDRRDENDCVFYNCGNKEFHTYIQSFGFDKKWGSRTDISEIMPVWNIAGTNLSVGFHEEHTKTEHITICDLWATIGKVKTILEQDFNVIPSFDYQPEYKYEYKPYDYYDDDYGYRYRGNDYWKNKDKDKKETKTLLPPPKNESLDDKMIHQKVMGQNIWVTCKPLEATDVIKSYYDARFATGDIKKYDNVNSEYYMDKYGKIIFKNSKTNVAFYVGYNYYAIRPPSNYWLTFRDLTSDPIDISVFDDQEV